MARSTGSLCSKIVLTAAMTVEDTAARTLRIRLGEQCQFPPLPWAYPLFLSHAVAPGEELLDACPRRLPAEGVLWENGLGPASRDVGDRGAQHLQVNRRIWASEPQQ